MNDSSTFTSARDGLLNPLVWLFSGLYAALMMGVYGFGLWAPQIVKSLGNLSNQQVGLVLMIPYACATLAMVLWGRHSDRTGERKWHLALPGVVGMIGFLYGGFTGNFYVAVIGFTLGAIGIYASLPLFWSLPTAILGGSAAAGGIALINSIGNLSGYLGPFVIGKLKDLTQSFAAGLLVIAAQPRACRDTRIRRRQAGARSRTSHGRYFESKKFFAALRQKGGSNPA